MEKCRAFGIKSLTDVEILSIILGTGVKNKDVLRLSREVFIALEKEGGLGNLRNIPIDRLKKIKGIGESKAMRLLSVSELGRRIVKQEVKCREDFNLPEKVAKYYMEDLRYESQEKVFLVALDTKNRRIGEKCVFIGSVNRAFFSPREILIEAVKLGAVSIILLHNHPSGIPEPSNKDIEITKEIVEASKIIGIPLIDHIVIGDNMYFSMNKRGIIDFF